MPTLALKDKCCGCSACVNICPQKCITMEADYTGFLYPVVDGKNCVDCKVCERVCPAIKQREVIHPEESTVHAVVQHKDLDILKESTSGGAFTAFAQVIIYRGGVVFGAAFDDEYSVKHVGVDSISNLNKFRSSKYVQSDIGFTYREAKKLLDASREVLFSGTPCQIAGLKEFLGKEYNSLYTIDVMCRAVPSPMILKKYVELCKERFSKIEKIIFRDKSLGYSFSTMAVYGERNNKKRVYRRGKESDEWHRLFFGGYCNRKSCLSCSYQSGKRVSDITMWDCFRVYDLAPQLDNNLGATNLIAWTKKGSELIKKATEYINCVYVPFDVDMKNLYRMNGLKANAFEAEFYQDARELNAQEFFKKYTPNTVEIYLKDWVRKMIMKLGIHDYVRKCIHRFRDKRHR